MDNKGKEQMSKLFEFLMHMELQDYVRREMTKPFLKVFEMKQSIKEETK